MPVNTTLAMMSLTLGLSAICWGQETQPAEAHVPTRLTRQADFGIPFRLSENSATPPVEVRLYVATSEGQDWKLYQRQRPQAQGFQFRARQDGEYWFAVRTVDRQGQLVAHESWQPEMKVIVDTKPPRLQLRLQPETGGRLTVQWTAEDPNLALHTLQLQYQAADGTWKPINVERPAEDDWRQEWRGQVTWQPVQAPSNVVVRASILDRAGNSTEARESLKSTELASSSREDVKSTNRFENRFAGGGAEPATDWRNRREQSPPMPSFLSDIRPSDQFGAASRQDLQPVRKPADNATPTTSYAPISSSIAPPVANQFPRRQPTRFSPDKTRFIASPHFALDYDLLDVGSKGASRIELWMTKDGGDHWDLYGADGDNLSPIEVRVENEGLYGFRILVHSFAGSPPPTPRPGERADIVVGVDWNRPYARIHRAAYAGVDRRSMTIEWQAEDVLLEETPITLQFGPTANGPWKVIETHLPNSGVYRWRPQQTLPDEVYIQIEVRDRAGNIAKDVYGSPVSRGEPRGIIRGVRPIENTSGRGRFHR